VPPTVPWCWIAVVEKVPVTTKDGQAPRWPFMSWAGQPPTTDNSKKRRRLDPCSQERSFALPSIRFAVPGSLRRRRRQGRFGILLKLRGWSTRPFKTIRNCVLALFFQSNNNWRMPKGVLSFKHAQTTTAGMLPQPP
jgi:hypothetical protein